MDALLVLFVPTIVTEAKAMAAAVERAAKDATKPILASVIGTHGVPEALAALRNARIPAYAFPEPAVLALARAVRYGNWLARPEGHVPALERVDAAAARAAFPTGREGWLAPDVVSALLAAYGLRGPRGLVVRDAEAAVAAAERIGYPVALKLVSERIVHKTEVGGVLLDLGDADAVRRAYRALERNLSERGLADAMEGALVQEMVRGGVETYVGMTEAPGFGALLAFGIGGVNVEVWKDVVFRVHPLTDVDAREMLDRIRGRALLDGFRGAPCVDKSALAEAILRVDRLVADFPEIHELDLNPLVALPEGRGVVALDARIRVGPPRA
nr:MAG: hypothetical protein DIU78_25575 [Pseudomonadota bacterium]